MRLCGHLALSEHQNVVPQVGWIESSFDNFGMGHQLFWKNLTGYIENNTWMRVDMDPTLSSSVHIDIERVSAANERDIECEHEIIIII